MVIFELSTGRYPFADRALREGFSCEGRAVCQEASWARHIWTDCLMMIGVVLVTAWASCTVSV